jgi:acyl carrier protein
VPQNELDTHGEANPSDASVTKMLSEESWLSWLGRAFPSATGASMKTRLVDDIGLDSMELIYAAVAVEELAGTQFPPEQPAKMETVADLFQYYKDLFRHNHG